MASSLREEPTIHAAVNTWMDLSSTPVASAILSRVLSEREAFQFDRMGHEEPLGAAFSLGEAIREWAVNISTRTGLIYGNLILQKAAFPHSGFIAHWQQKPSGLWLNHLGIYLDESYLYDDENRNRFLRLLIDLFDMTHSGYGSAWGQAEWEEKFWTEETLKNGRKGKRSIALKAQDGLADLYWANLFGPPYVRLFGRERLTSCPGVEVRWLGSESCLLLTCETPGAWSTPETRSRVQAAKKYLGTDAFFSREKRSRPLKKPTWPANG